MQKENERLKLTIEGHLPAELRGTYIRNGPEPVYPCEPYSFYDGDGMLHSVSIEDSGSFYSNKWVKTKGLAEERQAQKSLYASVLVSKPVKNTSNTSLMFYQQQLLSLWEWSFPYRINLNNLETEGEFHFANTLQDSFTAHPRKDFQTGKYYFFSHTIEKNSLLKIGIIEPDLKLSYQYTHQLSRANSAIHDLAITEKFLIFFDLPLLTDNGRIHWQPEQGGEILLFDKQFKNKPIIFKIQSGWVFHFINAFEKDGKVFVYACRWPKYPNEVDQPHIYEWQLDLTTQEVSERTVSPISAEMPVINNNFTAIENKFCYTTPSSYLPVGKQNTFAKTNLQTGETEEFNYDEGWVCGEPYFVSKGRGEDDGWVVNLVTSEKSRQSFLAVHEASVKGLPLVAKIHIPVFVPTGFHGLWVAK